MRQKMNHPLYFPLTSPAADRTQTHGKRSFVQILFDEFINNPENKGDTRVQFFNTWELREEIDRIEALNRFQFSDSVTKVDVLSCDKVDTIATKEFLDIKADITKVLLMEDWFFDKQRSVMDVRILALGIELYLSGHTSVPSFSQSKP